MFCPGHFFGYIGEWPVGTKHKHKHGHHSSSHFEAVCLHYSFCSSDGNFFHFTSSHHSTHFSFFLYLYFIHNLMKRPLLSFLLSIAIWLLYWLLTSPIMAFSSCLCNSQILLEVSSLYLQIPVCILLSFFWYLFTFWIFEGVVNFRIGYCLKMINFWFPYLYSGFWKI